MVGFLFIFRVLDKQDGLHHDQPEDKNAGLHVPYSFLIRFLKAHSKNLGFEVSVYPAWGKGEQGMNLRYLHLNTKQFLKNEVGTSYCKNCYSV